MTWYGTKLDTLERKTPEHQVTYESVRDLILFGHFSPGHPVTIQGLAKQLNAGITPVREAIRRLTTEQALETLDNRRVCVPIITAKKVEDLYFVREAIEPELAARAADSINKADIKSLSIKNDEVDHAIEFGDIHRYLKYNYRFHSELYRHAASETLCQIVTSIWLQLAPSLKVICGRMGTANFPDKHVELLTCLATGNSEAAYDAIKSDLQQGKEIVLNNLIK